MKALELNQDKQLNIVETAKPGPAKDQVLVAIKAAALNHREIWISKGLYPGMTLPCILGADGAGKIVEVGDTVDKQWLDKEVIIYPAYDWGTNDEIASKKFRVLGMPDPGTIAEYIAVPLSNVVEKPAYLSWEEAAAIPIAHLTAWRALTVHGQLKAGDNLLITGIGGGVAQAGLAIAKAVGANIYLTSSSNEKIDLAKKNGATDGVNYKDENWPKQLKEKSGGINVVLDSSPAANLDDYLNFLNIGAKVVYYGSTGSRKTTLNISKFFLRHIQFIGSTMGSPKDFIDVIRFLEQHKIIPHIHHKYTFANSIKAFEDLAKGEQVGKLVISI